MSQTLMEKYVEGLMDIFHRYCVRGSPCDMLSKGEFGRLLREEAPNFLRDLQASRAPQGIDDLFKELDQDKDAQVSFAEFTIFISKILKESHAKFHDDD